MRLTTFEIRTVLGRHERLGAMWGDRVVDLNLACAWRLREAGEPAWRRLADAFVPPDMRAFLEGGDRAMGEARAALAALEASPAAEGPDGAVLVHDRAAVRLLSPLPRPQSLRDFYAFEEHVKTGFAKRNEPIPAPWYEIPVYYKGNHRSIAGPEDDLLWPRYTQQLDFELELALVVGKEGRNIAEADAMAHVAGFMVMNDVSARDIQRKEMACRLGPAKGKDFQTVLGPWLVTPDEVGDLRSLPCRVRVNGEVWSESDAGSAYWTWPQILAHVSMDETLYPGDVLCSGTVGRGCGLELDRWIQPGDVVELEVDGIGLLRNRVGRPAASPGAPPPRP